MPSLSFSVPSLRDAILSGRKRCTTRPIKDVRKHDIKYKKMQDAKEYQLFWKLRTKETERLMNVKPGRVLTFSGADTIVHGPVMPIQLYDSANDVPYPTILNGYWQGDEWVFQTQRAFSAHEVAVWVYREGFDSMAELYDALHGFYDAATMRGLFYVVWWAWPPPVEQPDDAVWRGSD